MKKTIIVIVTILAIAIAVIYFSGLFSGTTPSSPNDGGQNSPTPTPSEESKVEFEFNPTEMIGSGLKRTVTYQLTNTGSADAHNARAKVEVLPLEASVELDEEYSVRDDIGTIKAGETVTRQAAFEFSLSDGLKLLREGASFRLTIDSDEHTQILSYDYQSE